MESELAAVDGEYATLYSSDDELVQAQPARTSRKRKLKHDALVLDDPMYASAPVTRRDAGFAPDSPSDSSTPSPRNQHSDDDGTDGSPEMAQAEADEDASSEGDELSSQMGLDGGQDGHDIETLEEEYRRMQAKSTQAAASQHQTQHDVRKAQAVAAQCRLWEHALGVRIVLQRALAAADRLPLHAARTAAMEHDVATGAQQSSMSSMYCAAQRACSESMAELLDAMDIMLTRQAESGEAGNPDRVADGMAAGIRQAARGSEKPDQDSGGMDKDRDDLSRRETAGPPADELWERMEALERRFGPFRDASMDRWQRKTQLAGGQAAMKAQLAALNQPLSRQVAVLRSNSSRLVGRAQRAVTQDTRRLCQPTTAPDANCLQNGASVASERETVHGGSLHDAGLETQEAGEPGDGPDVHAGATDPETYQDSTFYQVLLQEFLSNASDNVDASTLRVPTKRKNVDRRASKGRKIRYNVMDKLVGFMVPADTEANDEGRFAALFSNLFGSKAVAT